MSRMILPCFISNKKEKYSHWSGIKADIIDIIGLLFASCKCIAYAGFTAYETMLGKFIPIMPFNYIRYKNISTQSF